jgi:hypothetical protein
VGVRESGVGGQSAGVVSEVAECGAWRPRAGERGGWYRQAVAESRECGAWRPRAVLDALDLQMFTAVVVQKL